MGRRHLPEPTIIVEKPPAPETMVRYYALIDDNPHHYTLLTKQPNYMKPLKSRVRTPVIRSTIEAFSAKPLRHINEWEKALKSNEKPRFYSAFNPSYRLTNNDVDELERGWKAHRPMTSYETVHHFSQTKDRVTPKYPPSTGTSIQRFTYSPLISSVLRPTGKTVTFSK